MRGAGHGVISCRHPGSVTGRVGIVASLAVHLARQRVAHGTPRVVGPSRSSSGAQIRLTKPMERYRMKSIVILATAALVCTSSRETIAQQQTGPRPLVVGNRLGLPVEPAPDGSFEGTSPNVKVYGAIYLAESCSYDAERGLIVVANRGVPQNVQANNAWISFINHDGSVHTARWIGIASPADRSNLTPPLVLNDPLGSDIANGVLYVADRDGGTSSTDPSVAVIRKFDLKTGVPAGQIRVDRSAWFNDIAVADDGTIYATQTGDRSANPDPATWQVWKIAPDGTASMFVQ